VNYKNLCVLVLSLAFASNLQADSSTLKSGCRFSLLTALAGMAVVAAGISNYNLTNRVHKLERLVEDTHRVVSTSPGTPEFASWRDEIMRSPPKERLELFRSFFEAAGPRKDAHIMLQSMTSKLSPEAAAEVFLQIWASEPDHERRFKLAGLILSTKLQKAGNLSTVSQNRDFDLGLAERMYKIVRASPLTEHGYRIGEYVHAVNCAELSTPEIPALGAHIESYRSSSFHSKSNEVLTDYFEILLRMGDARAGRQLIRNYFPIEEKILSQFNRRILMAIAATPELYADASTVEWFTRKSADSNLALLQFLSTHTVSMNDFERLEAGDAHRLLKDFDHELRTNASSVYGLVAPPIRWSKAHLTAIKAAKLKSPSTELGVPALLGILTFADEADAPFFRQWVARKISGETAEDSEPEFAHLDAVFNLDLAEAFTDQQWQRIASYLVQNPVQIALLFESPETSLAYREARRPLLRKTAEGLTTKVSSVDVIGAIQTEEVTELYLGMAWIAAADPAILSMEKVRRLAKTLPPEKHADLLKKLASGTVIFPTKSRQFVYAPCLSNSN
jgi:hypothetical protein